MIEVRLKTLAKRLREDKHYIDAETVEDALEAIKDLKSDLDYIEYGNRGDTNDG